MIRRSIQLISALLQNAYWRFFSTKMIYQGRVKALCTPGLNCYSCPSATLACPMGAMQHFTAALRTSLAAGINQFGLYVIGFLGVIGSGVGRMPCGWICPFGFLQELIHKIPSKKFHIPRILNWLKYAVLALMIFILPFLIMRPLGYGESWFCKYACPAGTLEAGVPLMFLNPFLRERIGFLYYNKIAILAVFLALMVFTKRPFCRTTCPLGAFYALFNRFSAFRLAVSKDKCTKCDACFRDCPMDIKLYESPNQGNCIRCLRCVKSCKPGAISPEHAFKRLTRGGRGN